MNKDEILKDEKLDKVNSGVVLGPMVIVGKPWSSEARGARQTSGQTSEVK